MSYEIYKILHLAGLFLLLTYFGQLTYFKKIDPLGRPPKQLSAFHGSGLLLLFVSGFGLLAKIGITGAGWPLWVYLKIAVLILWGLIPMLAKRFNFSAGKIFVLGFLFTLVAFYSAIFQPG